MSKPCKKECDQNKTCRNIFLYPFNNNCCVALSNIQYSCN